MSDTTARYDAAIVGGGPAGSVCAALCAEGGLRTLLLERARFPRDKVCGDCINPSCFPVFERLGLAGAVRDLEHARLEAVDFIPIAGAPVTLSIREAGEISVKRALLDDLLLRNAIRKGAEVMQETTVREITSGWLIGTENGSYPARFLVGADGRNSLVARSAGLRVGATKTDRVAAQTHLKLPSHLRGRVALHLFSNGYAGYADAGGEILNLCLVGRSEDLPTLKKLASALFPVPDNTRWNSVTPISKPSAAVGGERVFLVGDAARVVEPFTGEGIYYALRSGELAAQAILGACRGERSEAQACAWYALEHRRMYRSRLWVNQLAKTAVVNPRIGDSLIRLGWIQPWILRYLTSKIVGAGRMTRS